MSKRKVTAQVIEEMRFMEDEMHMSRSAIAKEIGIDINTVTYNLGVKHPSSGKRLSKDATEKMLALRAKGLSNKQIAIELGVATKTVYARIGNQPTGNRSDYGTIVAHVTGDTFVKQKEEFKLQRMSTCVTFAGKDFTYEATDKGYVKISLFAGTALDFDMGQLENFIDELNEVHDWMKKNDRTPVILLDGKPKSQEKPLLL